MSPNSKMLIGALVAAALAIAVYYGAISQQTASNIQNQTNQSLGTTPVSQQANPPVSQNPTTQTPASNGQVSPQSGQAPR